MFSRRLTSLALALCGLAAATGLTLAVTRADDTVEQTASAGAVLALVDGTGEEALAAVPEDFGAVMGYTPVLVEGHLVRADGDCSSPVPLPVEFEPACQQHDYGYDLLRYAVQREVPLGRWARGSIDDLFADRVAGVCTDPGPRSVTRDACLASAQIAVAGVDLNSRRQGDGVPEESFFTSAALASSAMGAAGLAVAAVPGRRR